MLVDVMREVTPARFVRGSHLLAMIRCQKPTLKRKRGEVSRDGDQLNKSF